MSVTNTPTRVIDALVAHHRELEPAWCRRVLEATAVVVDSGPWTRVVWGWPGRVSVVEASAGGCRVLREATLEGEEETWTASA